MNYKEILNNAPEDATHIDGGEYLDATTASYWSLAKSKWCGVDELILQDDIRSLADIKRIVELEGFNVGLAEESCAQQKRIAELEKERDSLLRLISYVRSIVFSKVKCSYVSFKRPLEELLKDQSNG